MAQMLIRVLSVGLVRRRHEAVPMWPPAPVRRWQGQLTPDEAHRLGQFALQFLH